MTEVNEQVFQILETINNDNGVPKNVKEKIIEMDSMLKQKGDNTALKINKVLQELDDLSEENNIPEHVRTQIWNLASLLESII
ncbi:MAG: hypothetical protein CMH63_00505 [Nanoarchaeota archaeon]|jgi:uncharacterized protein (UPF0147 family)|nr:hypothetical protein [Nanoarchaeota archaeon]|tara:strand:+ start:11348 stop:11596 length:249 start_codon:yes stop_codon:yes gene_type:complete